MRALAVIPARGGSRRLPRKNVLDFLGRPMIQWTIEAARGSGCFGRVVVSTEDAEIAAAAGAAGAEVMARPAALAGHQATVAQVCLDVLERLEREGAAMPDLLCCLYATAPLRGAGDIRAVAALVEPGVWDFALAVTDYSHPPHQALRITPGGALAPMWPELVTLREEAVGPLCVDNGSTYAAHVPALRRHGHFYGPGLRGHRMPRERSVDIDVAADLELARCYAERASP